MTIDFDWLAIGGGWKNEITMLKDLRGQKWGYVRIGKKLGIAHTTVRYRLEKLGFPPFPSGGKNHKKNPDRNTYEKKLLGMKDKIVNMYADQICQILGCHKQHFYKIIRDSGLTYKRKYRGRKKNYPRGQS